MRPGEGPDDFGWLEMEGGFGGVGVVVAEPRGKRIVVGG